MQKSHFVAKSRQDVPFVVFGHLYITGTLKLVHIKRNSTFTLLYLNTYAKMFMEKKACILTWILSDMLQLALFSSIYKYNILSIT